MGLKETAVSHLQSLKFRLQDLDSLAKRWTLASFRTNLWQQTNWLGTPVLQLPTDLIVLQKLIFKTRPKFIIETGTADGGSDFLRKHFRTHWRWSCYLN